MFICEWSKRVRSSMKLIVQITNIGHESKHKRKGSDTRQRSRSWLAAPKIAGVQAAVTDRVLLAQPGEEALKAEPISAVWRGAVSVNVSVW